MPTIDTSTPPGIQPVGFSSGFTLAMSDEFNSATLDSKWQVFKDFSDSSVPVGNWDINNNNNSMFRMWWNGNTAADATQRNITVRSSGSNPFQSRYGFYEIRVKQCRGRGFFPAFWVFDLATQQELDFYECFSTNNGDTWTNGPPNWHPTDVALHQWFFGGSVQSAPSDDLGQRRYRYGPPRGSGPFPAIDFSAAQHVIGCYWDSSVIRMYLDGVQVGNDMTPTPQLGAGNNVQFYTLFDLWWGPNGGNPAPTLAETPQGSSNAMEVDYIRYWTIGGSSVTFNASVTDAPADGSTISGNVHFGIAGNLIQNAELLPSTGYTPKYGVFTISQGGTVGNLNWDTTALANGSITVRLSAFNTPPNQTGSEIVVFTRTYIINNLTPTPEVPDPDMEFIFDSQHGRRRGRRRRR